MSGDDSAFRAIGVIEKRSVQLDGHRTSVSLEPAFWQALREIADRRGLSLNRLVATVDRARSAGNLSSALRVFVLTEFREAVRAGGRCTVQGAGDSRSST